MSKPRYQRTVTVDAQTRRSTEDPRRWIHAGMLPATSEQLTAQLIAASAPAWLWWRLNDAVPDNRVLDSVEDVVALLEHPAHRRSRSGPSQLYAG
jgi:hypothetical protein